MALSVDKSLSFSPPPLFYRPSDATAEMTTQKSRVFSNGGSDTAAGADGVLYRAGLQDSTLERERNQATPRQAAAWLLLSFSSFPVVDPTARLCLRVESDWRRQIPLFTSLSLSHSSHSLLRCVNFYVM